MKTMKKTILIISSCNHTSHEKPTEPVVEKTKLERAYEVADYELKNDAEKIILLSIIKDIPNEKAVSVLRDYLARTRRLREDSNYIVKVVDTIAKKNNLSRRLTAAIIFSYQFEMVTKDEIIEEYRYNEH